jgi:hypothetical protein
VWIPGLQKHANTAKRIARVLIVTPKPEDDAKHLAKMIAGEVRAGADGSAVVPTGFGRADFVFLSREALGKMYPSADVSTLPARAGAGLELVVNDLSAAKAAAGTKAIASNRTVVVPPAAANGVLLAFVQG